VLSQLLEELWEKHMCTAFGERAIEFVLECMFLTAAYRLVALVSMAFGIVGIIACACCKDVDKKMNNKVYIATPDIDFVLSC